MKGLKLFLSIAAFYPRWYSFTGTYLHLPHFIAVSKMGGHLNSTAGNVSHVCYIESQCRT